MTKLSELRTAGDIRMALAHAVALRVIAHRVEHGLFQTALARGLGIEFHIDITPANSGLRETA